MEKEKAIPTLIKAGDEAVLLRNKPPLVDCRVLSEDYYQELQSIISEQKAEIEMLRNNTLSLRKELEEAKAKIAELENERSIKILKRGNQ